MGEPSTAALIGTGDWNDGMNRVGEKGMGESIWLGWFLYLTLSDFALIADQRGENARAANWRQHAAILNTSLEQAGWDGAWYRRGYFDDGSPLGSASSSECRIDAIAQSWAVISGGADPAHAAAGMAAADQYPGTARVNNWPCSLPRPSIKRPSTPVTSRDTRPESVKTAGSTRMRQFGQ